MWTVTYASEGHYEVVTGNGMASLTQLLQGLAHERKTVTSVSYVLV